MSTHKYIDRICVAAVILSLLLTVVFMNGEALGLQTAGSVIGYENRLFDTSRVHSIDIVMDGWDEFIESCESEEYSVCAVVIDGESYKNVGIRAKGNTSLSSVSGMGSDRYSFKIEFDQYDSGKSYYGLDKLSLNNLIQDNTCMKDYLVYQMMGQFGVDAPLCSYVYITVNGEDWGLYLAVEGVEEAFLQRNYGSGYGELYKPDSMSFGAGRGNGRDFDMDGFMDRQEDTDTEEQNSGGFGNFDPGTMQPPEGAASFPENGQGGAPQEADPAGAGAEEAEGGQAGLPSREDFDPSSLFGNGGDGFGSSSDVKLQYIDDDPESYANIFDNAKTAVTEADQERLIASLKQLSEYEDLEEVLDTEEVLRYFVVHSFTVNGDSYTGSMVHNYYLYEEDGKLSMIPWDYNLAFGTFTGGAAASSVNDAIDDVLSDRPMQAWIFSDETYTRRYHELYAEFLSTVDIDGIIGEAYALIAPYVERDPSKFCTYEEFEAGVEALRTFCRLRTESVQGQLDGTIPSTSEGQSADSAALVDASGLDLSDMGTMSSGGGMNAGGGFGGGFSGGSGDGGASAETAAAQSGEAPSQPQVRLTASSERGQGGEAFAPEDGELPDGFDPSAVFGGEERPGSGEDSSDAAAERPSGGRDGDTGGFSPGDLQEPSSDSYGTSLFLLAASALVLLGGLLFAFRYKRYKR